MIFSPEQQNERLKWCFDSTKNGAWGDEPNGDHDVVCLRAADFDGATGRLNDDSRTIRAIDLTTFAKVSLQPGDLIIEKSGGGEKQLVGRAVLFNGAEPSVCSNFLARARPSAKADSAYLNYLLLAIYNARGTWPHIKQSTGIQNLDMTSYLNTRVSIPPLPIQRRIAEFLDVKTAQIDALIEKKRALLDRLAEKRQALITHAVTKGLDSNAPMNDSGIDWLGKIPAHWDVKALKYISNIGNGSTPRRDDSSYWDGGTYPWLNSSVVNLDSVATASDLVTDCALKECHLPRIEPPAVLVGITGEGRTRGMASLLVFEATINQHLAYIKPRPKKADASYLRHVMSVAYTFLRNESDGGGSTKGAITCAQLANMKVPVPPHTEQVSIAHHVIEKYSAISTLSQEVAKSVEYLAEYRTALIAAAVTGNVVELQ